MKRFVWQGVETYFSHDRISKVDYSKITRMQSFGYPTTSVSGRREYRTYKQMAIDIIVKYNMTLESACIVGGTDKGVHAILTEREVIDILIKNKDGR